MATNTQSRTLLRFDAFEVHVYSGELRKNGKPVRLQEQPFQILRALLEKPGEIVSREELKQQLWPADTFVDFDDGLNTAVKKLRDTLGDSSERPRYIETIPRRGYRFIGELDPLKSPQAAPLGATEAKDVGIQEITPFWRRRVRLVWGLFSVAALIVAVLVLRKSFSTPPTNIQSIAVLPFSNFSVDPSQDYFADAMTEELTSDLGNIAALRVISRTSAMHYKKTPKTAPEIAHELNVDGVIEGSVLRSGDRVRITAQLINAHTDRHLWSESYERDLKDILALQSEIAHTIAGQVRAIITPTEQKRLQPEPVNPAAYDAYLLGNYHASKRNPAAMEKAIEYFQKAIRLDPAYAQAYAGLAAAYLESEVWSGLGLGKSADQVRANTLKAIELDGELAEAHSLLGDIYFQYDWDWAHSEMEFKRAIELNANSPRAYQHYAFLLQTMSRHDEAIAAAHHAVELDPLSVLYISDEARILYRARRYDEAIARYERALELDPGYISVFWRIADAYEQLGKFDEALVWAQKYQQATGDQRLLLALRARINSRMGKRSEAMKDLRTFERNDKGGNESLLAALFAALGDNGQAIAELERGVRTHSFLPFVLVDPQLDALRSDPRFQQLLRRVNLP